MDLPLSRSVAPELIVLAEAGSTNDELATGAESRPHLATIVTASQTSGRGRLGREWVALPGKTLAISVLLRPDPPLPMHALGWLPLLAGVAMTNAVDAIVEAGVSMKWPNDVLIDGRKVSGILTELLPGAVIVGAGLNLELAEHELPVPTATSLRLSGAEETGNALADRALSAYLAELGRLTGVFVGAGGDAERSGIRSLVIEKCGTIGQRVRVHLPDGTDVNGVAEDIDETGRLVVRSEDAGVLAVAAGDVTHLRYE